MTKILRSEFCKVNARDWNSQLRQEIDQFKYTILFHEYVEKLETQNSKLKTNKSSFGIVRV